MVAVVNRAHCEVSNRQGYLILKGYPNAKRKSRSDVSLTRTAGFHFNRGKGALQETASIVKAALRHFQQVIIFF
jgi:hypothetical protein